MEAPPSAGKSSWRHSWSRRCKHLRLVYDHSIIDLGLIPLGFGLYLRDVDPERRAPTWHVLRTIRLCKDHFQRGVEKQCRPDGGQSLAYSRLMMRLLDAPSRNAYDRILADVAGTSRSNIGCIWVRSLVTVYHSYSSVC